MSRNKEEKTSNQQQPDYEEGPHLINLDSDKDENQPASEQRKTPAAKVKQSRWRKWIREALSPMGLFTLTIAFAAILQYIVTKAELGEMRSSSVSTKRLTDETHELAVATKKQADAAIIQAKQIEATQRPWVGASNPISVEGPVFAIESYQPKPTLIVTLIASIRLQNFGTSLARREVANFFADIRGDKFAFPVEWESGDCAITESMSRQTMVPINIIMPATQAINERHR